MDIITRQEAKAQGLTHYFTGKPCKREHVTERFVSNKTCCQCILERQQTQEYKAQQAAYCQANAEKIAEYRRANTEQRAAYDAERYRTHTERYAAQSAAYRLANAEKIAAYSAAYNAAYRKANPHLINALTAKRRATKLQQTPSWVDFEAIKAIYRQCAERTRLTGEQNHVDHIYPLISDDVCGLHVAANLQIITASENSRKNNRMPTPEQVPSDLE
jgi:hypothetical protein